VSSDGLCGERSLLNEALPCTLGMGHFGAHSWEGRVGIVIFGGITMDEVKQRAAAGSPAAKAIEATTFKKESVFEVYREGFLFMSVCTDMTPEEAERYAQVVKPSGTMQGWRISKDKFRTGETNPCPCDQHPLTRIHILFDC
jgi:hypothetical protein